MSVRRYDTYLKDLGEHQPPGLRSVVLASDYDALAAELVEVKNRLAVAEEASVKLLDNWRNEWRVYSVNFAMMEFRDALAVETNCEHDWLRTENKDAAYCTKCHMERDESHALREVDEFMNQAGTAPSDADLPRSMPKGSLPNSLGDIFKDSQGFLWQCIGDGYSPKQQAETVTKPYPAWFGSPTLIDRIDESMERGIPFDLALSECAQWAELRSEAIAKLREYYGSSEYHAYQSKNAAETEGEKKVCPPIHKRRQGENEWVFQQSCQCSRCRNLYEQLVADQEMDKQRREMER